MRAALYTPYLDSVGGGERYVLSIAKALLEEGWSVDIEAKDRNDIKKAEKRFGMDLSNVKDIESIKRGDGYDACFWLSDGSIPRLLSRKNIIHFQRPFRSVDGKSLINRMKFMRVNAVIVNSYFTKQFIDVEFPVRSTVVYPPVDIDSFAPAKKKKIMCYVGRFSELEQSKRQDIVLEQFQIFHNKVDDSWRLVLAGGSDVGRTDFVDNLKKRAKTYPIEVWENKPFEDIQKLMAESQIFISAAGYGVDEVKEPNKVEHFGITTVEAMSSGAIPLVYSAGGPKEVVSDGENGYIWKSTDALQRRLESLTTDTQKMKSLSQNAVISATRFSYDEFKKNILSLL